MPTTHSRPLSDLTHANRWIKEFPKVLDELWLDNRFRELMEFIETFDGGVDGWIEAIHWHNEIVSHISTVAQMTRLRFRCDTTDADATAEFTRIRHLFPAIEHHDITFLRSVLASPELDEIQAIIGESWVSQVAVEVGLHDPANADLGVAIGDLLSQRTRLFGQATFEWRGKTQPMSFARSAALETDTTERRAAFASVNASLHTIEADLQSVFDEAQTLRLQIASNAKAASYTDFRYREMGRVDWSQTDAATFRAAVLEHIVPIAKKLRLHQAQQQGAELVHPADTHIWPSERAVELAVTVPELRKVARSMFDEMGGKFAESFAVLDDYDLLDIDARPGKEPGGSCSSLPDQRVTFIFSNNTGSPSDVTVLVHEAGHSLQKWCSRHIDLALLRQPTLEACEIHSMTLELLAHPWAETFFGESADTYRSQHLRDQFIALPYMAAVDEFQHQIYDPTRNSPTTAADRAELWETLMRTYLPGIDWDIDPWHTKHYWLRQQHITNKPFYYLDYALAQVVSWQLWLDSLEDTESATERYLKLCELGGSFPFRTLLQKANVGDPFEPKVVADVARRIQERLVQA